MPAVLRRCLLAIAIALTGADPMTDSLLGQAPPNETLTAVPGSRSATTRSPPRPTGCTVVLAEAGATAGVDVRGSAPGTRETDLLNPVNLVDRVHAIVLAGGSAFGLDTAVA